MKTKLGWSQGKIQLQRVLKMGHLGLCAHALPTEPSSPMLEGFSFYQHLCSGKPVRINSRKSQA